MARSYSGSNRGSSSPNRPTWGCSLAPRKPEPNEGFVDQLRQQGVVFGMERSEADGVRRKRRLDVGHPVVQRATHPRAMGVRHEHKAAHPAGEQGLDKFFDRALVVGAPQMRVEIRPHGLEQPFGHEVRMDVDQRKRKRRGLGQLVTRRWASANRGSADLRRARRGSRGPATGACGVRRGHPRRRGDRPR